MVAGTLITIVLATIPTTYSGAASSLINTTIQVGVAAGIAVVGSVFFARLENAETPTDSALAGLGVVIGLYVAAAAVALILPGGRIPTDRSADTTPDLSLT